ncbi:MAG: Rieske 2Fe-2S domain-containing protein [Gammaproteobacteria bacterium]|nr:Rieske 2Fe-2S domain-containing protein [Gammaproteobacteria bacterium]
MRALRPYVFALSVDIGDILGLADPYWVDDNTILRISYPYKVARLAPQDSLLSSSGTRDKPAPRWLDSLKSLLLNSRISRPVRSARNALRSAFSGPSQYNIRSYHRGLPRAAWAHGPHKDTWHGLAKDSINLWWSIDGVNKQNSVLLYPETFGKEARPDPTSMYLAAGQELPRPVTFDMNPGEVLVFNPEILHGTRLNTSDETRVAISTRLNPTTLVFDNEAPFFLEHWHLSTNIRTGRTDRVQRISKKTGSRRKAKSITKRHSDRRCNVHDVYARLKRLHSVVIGPSDILQSNQKALFRLENAQVLVLRRQSELLAFSANCPHLGVCLIDGYNDEAHIYCPGHGLEFDLSTGDSSCGEFSLRRYWVKEENGLILLGLSDPCSA